MKSVIIVLILIILLIFGYNKYADYQRFQTVEARHQPSENIDVDFYDQEVVYNYYEAIEGYNSHIQTQWSANGIDVRNPEQDDEQTLQAVARLSSLKAKITYYQSKLEKSKLAKENGMANKDIQWMMEKGLSIEQHKKEQALTENKRQILSLYSSTANNNLTVGSRGPLVQEVQKLLTAKGYETRIDGNFKQETFEALRAFEEKEGFYADGKLDALTLDHLLN